MGGARFLVPTPRALYYSSACYGCYLPFPSRELLAPLAFPNTARPILLKRLLRLLSPLSLARAPRASRVPQHRAPYITQAPAAPPISPFPRASSSRLPRSPTPRALYYSSACYGCYLPFPSRELLAPPAFPNTARPILLKRLLRLLSPLSLARAPRASRVPQHPAPYITPASATPAISPFPRASSSRLPRSPTPRALCYSSACYGCYLPFPSRELLAPPAFPNTARPILLKRLLRLLSPLSLARAPRASRVPQHRAPYITQAPATAAISPFPRASSSRLSRSPTPRALHYSSACYGCYLPFPSRELLAPLAFPNTARPILLKRLLRRLNVSEKKNQKCYLLLRRIKVCETREICECFRNNISLFVVEVHLALKCH